MNSQTKIIVLRRRNLLVGAIAALIALVLIFCMFAHFLSGAEKSPVAGGMQTGLVSAETVAANADVATDTQTKKSVKKSKNKLKNTYTPGVYTSTLTLNGNPVSIEVTVDKNSIQNITLGELSESVTTMYPMLPASFAELKDAVIATGSTKNITYDAENKYTATMLLNGIAAALEKCTVR